MATGPHSPRRPADPTRRTIVVAAILVQAGLLTAAWGIHQANIRLENPPQLVRQVLTAEDLVFADTDVALTPGKRLPPVDLAKAMAPDTATIDEGRQLYGQHCSSCHGDEGRGDGPAGVTLAPRPRNLSAVAGWTRGTRPSDLFTTVTIGLEGTQMPGFEYLAVEERFAVTHFVMTLASGHEPDTRASIDDLDRRFALSEGASEPNVIPLAMAIERLASEAPAAPGPGDGAAEAELARLEPRGAELFAMVVDPDRADIAGWWLAADRSWVGSPTRLRVLAMPGVPSNGFTPRSGLLSAADWAALERYLAHRYHPDAGAGARD